MLTKEMFDGKPFDRFLAVLFSEYEEYDPETDTITKSFQIIKIKEEDFDKYDFVEESSRIGMPRVKRVQKPLQE